MVGALRSAAAKRPASTSSRRTAIADFAVGPAGIAATLGGGTTIEARLLVAADGVRSRLRDLAGIGTVGWSYGQSGIVVTVAHEQAASRPRGGAFPARRTVRDPAAEGQPLVAGVDASRPTIAERLVARRPPIFQLELERRFGHQPRRDRGRSTSRGPFRSACSLARDFVTPRFALAGDAAHGIHPIAGQGLNLGYRDVAALAETIVEAHRLGLDIGVAHGARALRSAGGASTQSRWALVTDGLNRLFSNDNPALRIVRDVGLGLVDRLPRLKRMFIGEAAGEGGELPRLLRGEAI